MKMYNVIVGQKIRWRPATQPKRANIENGKPSNGKNRMETSNRDEKRMKCWVVEVDTINQTT